MDTLAGKLILVVDDEPSILSMLCDFIHMLGGTAIGLANAGAHDIVLRGTCHLMLIDMMLNGSMSTSGLTLAHELREDGYAGPIVAMTGADDMMQLARDDDVFAAQMRKPLDLSRLLELLLRTLAPE